MTAAAAATTTPTAASTISSFAFRYYIGHRGKFGHEFLELELVDDGLLRYVNNSAYRDENIIRKSVHVSDTVIEQLHAIIADSGILALDGDTVTQWPQPDTVGKCELTIAIDGRQYQFVTSKLAASSLKDIDDYCANVSGKDSNKDSVQASLQCLYYLLSDLKSFVLSLMALHFKVRPV